MKYLLLIITALISSTGFAADAVDNPGISAGASNNTHANNSAGASTSASYDAKGSASDGNTDATITNTVETFKSPGMDSRPRTTFNTGTDTQIDHDITDLNPPDVNQGGVTKPDVK